MRVTKDMFLSVIKDISIMMGEQLYLVPVYDTLYVTPVNDGVRCQSNYYYCFSNKISNANYEKLVAFKVGVGIALRRMQNR